jgi:nitroreductase
VTFQQRPGDEATPFLGVVHRQRGCRRFLPADLPTSTLQTILNAATMAPSSENCQPWLFVVVRKRHTRTRLLEIKGEVWDSGASSPSRSAMDANTRGEVARGFTEGLATAPVLVVVGADRRLVSDRWLSASIYPAVQNMLLAAYAVGAASALTTIALIRAEQVAAEVSVVVGSRLRQCHRHARPSRWRASRQRPRSVG